MAGSHHVRVGLYENRPKVFTDEDGRPAGIFVEILEAVAREEGWEIEYVPGTFAEGLKALAEGRIDLMPDVAHSPERDRIMDFHAEPVLESWSQVYVRPDLEVDSLVDLEGCRLALLEDSIQHDDLARLLQGFGYRIELVPIGSYEQAFSMASTGEVEAVVSNHFFGDASFRRHGLTKTPIVFNPCALYYAVRQGGHADLLSTIDRQLQGMKEEPGSAYYRALGKWMDRPPTVVVPRIVRFSLIALGGILLVALLFILLLRFQVRNRTRHLARTNEILKESEERFRRLVEQSPDGIVVVTDGRIRYINPTSRMLLGVGDDDVVDRLVVDFFSDDSREEVDERLGRAIAGAHSPRPLVATCVRQDGDAVAVEITTVAMIYEDMPSVLCHLCDITSRLEAERARQDIERQRFHVQRLESVGRVASGIGHDFNNLLSVIQGFGDMLEHDEGMGQAQRKRICSILQACTRAQGLARQLLDLSREETSQRRLLVVDDFLGNLIPLLRDTVGPTISVDSSSSAVASAVMADPGQIERVMINLAVNAREAMKGKGHLCIDSSKTMLDEGHVCAPDLPEGEYVRITVQDDGCGMDETITARIFEPRFTTKTDAAGHGLGLATSYNIIRRHGGGIYVESEPGQGTTFTILLPIRRSSS